MTLVARGFVFSLRRLGAVVSDNVAMGIPSSPIYLFLFLTGALLLTLLLGVTLLIHSEGCYKEGDRVDPPAGWHGPRSPLMFTTTLLTMILTPIFLTVGRFVDIGDVVWVCMYHGSQLVEGQAYQPM